MAFALPDRWSGQEKTVNDSTGCVTLENAARQIVHAAARMSSTTSSVDRRVSILTTSGRRSLQVR